MLKELKKYENLGTPTYFWELFEQLRDGNLWTLEDVSGYFFNRIIDGESIFDGCLPLLQLAKIIEVDEKGVIEIAYKYKHIFRNEEMCKKKILKGILDKLLDDEEFYTIFSAENVSYDYIIHKTVDLNFSAFGLKYANVRNLLIDFDFLKPHLDFPQKKLIVNPYWKIFFDQNITKEIRKRVISPEELEKRLNKQNINGFEAEEFVFIFEKKRLNNKDGIDWIAQYNVNAGYDIDSFDTSESIIIDRFIEVKSYSKKDGGAPYFYWSKNEVATAEKYKENYYIYLVNRDEIKNPDYKPTMISNPIKNILNNNNWEKIVDKYYVTEIT